jgi:hypothetical protein
MAISARFSLRLGGAYRTTTSDKAVAAKRVSSDGMQRKLLCVSALSAYAIARSLQSPLAYDGQSHSTTFCFSLSLCTLRTLSYDARTRRAGVSTRKHRYLYKT